MKFLEDEARKILPKGYVARLHRRIAPVARRGQQISAALSARGRADLSRARRAVQQLPRSVHHSARLGSAGDVRRAALQFSENAVGKFFTDGWTTTFNIYSQVGLVTLVGLVSKNGILIVQFANELQREGLNKLEAVAQAARMRLRPVLMTSVATVAGHFPLTLVTGAGAAARNSIGLVLVAGMAIGTIFTLFIVPSLYMLIAKEHHEGRLDEPEEEPEIDNDGELTPELAMARHGNGNGWKQA